MIFRLKILLEPNTKIDEGTQFTEKTIKFVEAIDFVGREKSNVLAKSTDFGQNLPGVENLIKRHKRLKLEMENHSKVAQVGLKIQKAVANNTKFGSFLVSASS